MRRLHYIDNLRVACMLLGVVVHVTTLGNFGVFSLVADFSDLFRMATFFMISGFFGVMLHRRYGTQKFLTNRLRTLAIPLISAVVLLNPLTLLLVFQYHNGMTYPDAGPTEVWHALTGQIPSAGHMVWHLHLWFLISLIVYVVSLPLLSGGLQRVADGLAGLGIMRWREGILVPLILAVGVMFAVLAALVMLHLAGPRLAGEWLIRATLTYWPFFLLGALLFCNESLWQAVQRADLPLFLVTLGLMAVSYVLTLPDGLEAIFTQIIRALQRCWITFALLSLFRRWMGQSGRLTELLSRSIYTVYLFHYLIIYIVASVWVDYLPIDKTAFVVISLIACFAAIALHYFIIERVALLGYLFNGKVQAQARQPENAT